MTVKLQGIYNKQEAKAVKELKTGDVIMWNYGYTSTVVDLIPSKTGKSIAHKSFAISIVNNDSVRIDWLHISARSQNEAIRKARATAARGCYKDQLDTITATESGIEYTYKTI